MGNFGFDAARISYFGRHEGAVSSTDDNANQGPRGDRLYAANTRDVNTRQIYYGVGGEHTTFIQGKSGAQNRALINIATDILIDSLSLLSPLAEVHFKRVSISGDVLSVGVEARLTELGTTTSGEGEAITGEHKVFVAVLERGITLDGRPYNDVLRKMLPSASGAPIEFDATTKAHEVEVEWRLNANNFSTSDVASLKLHLVAFVQRLGDRSVYQAASTLVDGHSLSPEAVYIQGVRQQNNQGVVLYPNPAQNQIFMYFTKPLQHACQWRIIDENSQTQSQGTLAPGTHTAMFPLTHLPSGTYYITITQANKQVLFRRLIKSLQRLLSIHLHSASQCP